MEAAGLHLSLNLVLWFRTGGPWTGLGTSLGLGPLCTSPVTTPPVCVPESDGTGMGKHSGNALSLCGAGGVLLRTGEGRCQISDKVIFTLGVEAGR